MSSEKCSICARTIDTEVASILAMGGYGHPRYVCDSCAEQLERATTARDASEVESAMAEISKRLAATNTDDRVVIDTVNSIFSEAGERAKRIKDGSYDFSLDEQEKDAYAEDEGIDVPEELLESEEDKALDEAEEKKKRKFDKIFNWVMIVLSGLALSALVYVLIKVFI